MRESVNNINTYRRIALNCRDSYQRCENNLKACNSISMGDDGIQFRYELYAKMYGYSVQALIFSALAVEAFANDFLMSNLGKKEFEMLDKLEIKGKILIGTKLVTQKEFPVDKDAYSKLHKLIVMRNKLVHAKSADIDSDASKIYLKIEKRDMEDAISTYELIIREIDSLKPDLKVIEKYFATDENLRNWYYLNA